MNDLSSQPEGEGKSTALVPALGPVDTFGGR
jgi:hypothetical protein